MDLDYLEMDGMHIINLYEHISTIEKLLETEPFLTNLEINLENLNSGDVVDVGNLDKDAMLALRDIYSVDYNVYSSEDAEHPGKYALAFELKAGTKK